MRPFPKGTGLPQEVICTRKNHFLIHMTEGVVKQGPAATWTDADESFNRVVKQIFASTLIGDARTFSKLWLFHNIDRILASSRNADAPACLAQVHTPRPTVVC
jgi:hypothetical protein